ncbi:MAG: 1-acyl-sn-glycerol-3-phosphate acyltransferase, partial [Actinomycetota bacterium]
MTVPSLADLVGASRIRLPQEPPLPSLPPSRRPVFLLDAATGLEDRLLRGWLCRAGAPADHEVMRLAPSRIRRRGLRTDPRLPTKLTDGHWLVPLRVVWMPAERHGQRTVSWVDVIKLGDPRDPRWLRDYLILSLFPDRVRILVGDGAPGTDLASVHDGQDDLIHQVTRRAWLALDRAERKERGNRYKIPRFVAEDILSRPAFRYRVVSLGEERRLPPSRSVARARRYLSEIAATHSPFLIDLIANLIHWIIRQGYGTIHYDERATERIARLGGDHPLVFLPSHKSNLDRLSLQFLLWENDLPPNHTAGGINMNFFPVGPLVRRTGVFFIRRSFKGNELYKHVLRSYLDYLIEKRFPLEWYLEGGRSRTGKLRAPRYGLLSWVVDSFARGITDDIYLLPVSIAYDHIQEVGAYAVEAAGGRKEKESFSWAFRFARNLRRAYGDIHVRFAQPVSMAAELKGSDLGDDNPIEVQKLAFEVMHRISMATPVTPTALISTVLLAAKGRALRLEAITHQSGKLASYIHRRELPVTVPELPADDAAVE